MAAHLGEWNVDGMLEEMPSDLFARWMAYFRVNPFGQVRGDYQAAMQAWTTARCNWSGKGRRPQFKDFILDFEEEKPATPEMQVEYVKAWVLACGGSVN